MLKFFVFALVIAHAAGFLPSPRGVPAEWKRNEGRIIGGAPATEGQYPYMVSLRTVLGVHFCGGAIVGEKVVLTSGSCIDGRSPTGTYVHAGTILNSEPGIRYRGSQLKIHEGYNATSFENDIGMIIVETSIGTTDKIASVPLSRAYIGTNMLGILTGWGYTTNPGIITASTLKAIELTTMTVRSCRDAWGELNPVFENQLCTATQRGEGACGGDAGGPLVRQGLLIGILSWGSPCARGIPDVHNRISSFADWISENSPSQLRWDN